MKEHIQKFDGKQPEINRKGLRASRITFQNGISELLETHRDYVDMDPVSRDEDSLRLQLETPTDDGITRINIKRNPTGSLPDQIGRIDISTIQPNGSLSPERHFYEPDDEGVIRRMDHDVEKVLFGAQVEQNYVVNPITGHVTKEFMDPQTAMAAIEERVDLAFQAIKIEEEAGLNNQPVTPNEVRGLIEVAKQGDIPLVTGLGLQNLVAEGAVESGRIPVAESYADTEEMRNLTLEAPAVGRAEYETILDDRKNRVRPTLAENYAAGGDLYDLIEYTLDKRGTETHVDEETGIRKWTETTALAGGGRWTTEVAKRDDNTTGYIATEAQYPHEGHQHVDTTVFKVVGLRAQGAFEKKVMGDTPEDVHTEVVQTALGVGEVRQVRNYLKYRKPAE